MNVAESPHRYEFDLTVSFVLFHTSVVEVALAVRQVCQSKLRSHVFLVDNSVPPLDLPKFDDREVTILRPGKNLGYGKAHNQAIAVSRGLAPYHLVANTDVTYQGEALEKLYAFMENRPEVGLAMPKIRYPDGSIQYLCRLLPHPMDIFGRGLLSMSGWAGRRNRRYECRDWEYDRVASFPFLSGCFMFMRRSVLDQTGGFDERFFLYAEDIDLSRRFHITSETLFVPDAEAVHEYRSGLRPGPRLFILKTINFFRYFNKWGWFFDRERDRINRLTVQSLKSTTPEKGSKIVRL